jgi:hypothetical protein
MIRTQPNSKLYGVETWTIRTGRRSTISETVLSAASLIDMRDLVQVIAHIHGQKARPGIGQTLGVNPNLPGGSLAKVRYAPINRLRQSGPSGPKSDNSELTHDERSGVASSAREIYSILVQVPAADPSWESAAARALRPFGFYMWQSQSLSMLRGMRIRPEGRIDREWAQSLLASRTPGAETTGAGWMSSLPTYAVTWIAKIQP